MERWYAGYECKRNPQEVIRYISQKVQEHNLSSLVPLLRVEKKAKGGKKYFFFIAFQSDCFGQLPEAVINAKLLDPSQPYFKSTAVHPKQNKFKYDDIKSMVGIAHQVEDYTNPIPYILIEPEIIEDPFSLLIDSQESNSIDTRYQNLLHYLSALGSGTWEKFNSICQVLEISEPRRILRKLKLLGHLETSLDGRKWSIAATSFVLIDSRGTYLICGQQTESLLNQLAEYGTVTRNPLRNSIELDDYSPEQVIAGIQKSLAIQIHNSGRVSKRLAEILPDLEAWQARLPVLNGIVPSLYRWQYFQDGQFIESGLPRETGMYQMLNRENDYVRSTVFYESEMETFRRGDWYGLRFLALQASDTPFIVHHEASMNRLALLYSQRWPEIYERVLVLASGYLPQFVEEEMHLWLIYEGIDSVLLNLMIQKLKLIREA
jgi:hypothetical protein